MKKFDPYAYASVTSTSYERSTVNSVADFHGIDDVATDGMDACTICQQYRCLYNQPGRICTLFKERYIFSRIADAPILVNLLCKESICRPPLFHCSVLHKDDRIIPLVELDDGLEVTFDAVAVGRKFQAVAVWTLDKPRTCGGLTEIDSFFVLQEIKGLPVISANGAKRIVVDAEGQPTHVELPVYVNSATINLGCHSLLVADVYKVLTGEGGLLLLCSSLYSSDGREALFLPLILKPRTVYKAQNGYYVPCPSFTKVYCDIFAVLVSVSGGYELHFEVDGVQAKATVSPSKIFRGNDLSSPDFCNNKVVMAHVARHGNDEQWMVIMVQAAEGVELLFNLLSLQSSQNLASLSDSLNKRVDGLPTTSRETKPVPVLTAASKPNHLDAGSQFYAAFEPPRQHSHLGRTTADLYPTDVSAVIDGSRVSCHHSLPHESKKSHSRRATVSEKSRTLPHDIDRRALAEGATEGNKFNSVGFQNFMVLRGFNLDEILQNLRHSLDKVYPVLQGAFQCCENKMSLLQGGSAIDIPANILCRSLGNGHLSDGCFVLCRQRSKAKDNPKLVPMLAWFGIHAGMPYILRNHIVQAVDSQLGVISVKNPSNGLVSQFLMATDVVVTNEIVGLVSFTQFLQEDQSKMLHLLVQGMAPEVRGNYHISQKVCLLSLDLFILFSVVKCVKVCQAQELHGNSLPGFSAVSHLPHVNTTTEFGKQISSNRQTPYDFVCAGSYAAILELRDSPDSRALVIREAYLKTSGQMAVSANQSVSDILHCGPVHAFVVPISPSIEVYGFGISHLALVAWKEKKPPNANRILADFSASLSCAPPAANLIALLQDALRFAASTLPLGVANGTNAGNLLPLVPMPGTQLTRMGSCRLIATDGNIAILGNIAVLNKEKSLIVLQKQDCLLAGGNSLREIGRSSQEIDAMCFKMAPKSFGPFQVMYAAVVAWVGVRPSDVDGILVKWQELPQKSLPVLSRHVLSFGTNFSQWPGAKDFEGAFMAHLTKVGKNEGLLRVTSKLFIGKKIYAWFARSDIYIEDQPLNKTNINDVSKLLEMPWQCHLAVSHRNIQGAEFDLQATVVWSGGKPPSQKWTRPGSLESFFSKPKGHTILPGSPEVPAVNVKQKSVFGLIEKVDSASGDITVNGSNVQFSRDGCFLYGVCLHGLDLRQVLRTGLIVECELPHDNGFVKGVWVGGMVTLEPAELLMRLNGYCDTYSLSVSVRAYLLSEAGLIPSQTQTGKALAESNGQDNVDILEF